MATYSNRLIEGQPHIWLQSYGWAAAKPAGEFKVGDCMLWNFGYSSEIIAVNKETAKTIEFIELCEGKEYKRTFKKERWVAISKRKNV